MQGEHALVSLYVDTQRCHDRQRGKAEGQHQQGCQQGNHPCHRQAVERGIHHSGTEYQHRN